MAFALGVGFFLDGRRIVADGDGVEGLGRGDVGEMMHTFDTCGDGILFIILVLPLRSGVEVGAAEAVVVVRLAAAVVAAAGAVEILGDCTKHGLDAVGFIAGTGLFLELNLRFRLLLTPEVG